MLNKIYHDILLEITEYLRDIDVINMLKCSKYLYHLRKNYKWKTYVNEFIYNKIKKLNYFDNFTNVYLADNHIFFPKNATTLHLGINFNPLIINNIPKTIKNIKIDCTNKYDVVFKSHPQYEIVYITFFDKKTKEIINVITLSNSLSSLTYGCYRDRGDMSSNITTRDCYCKYFFENSLPNNLTYLKLGDYFNTSLSDILPHSLLYLTLGHNFNKSIVGLPKYLKSLTLGDRFNKDINDCLPSTLTYLKLGKSFDHDVETLPKSVTHIIFHWFYTGDISKLLKSNANSIKYLKLHKRYKKITSEYNIPIVEFY